jgi:hypothetical protein
MAELQACGATLDEVIPKSKIKYQPNALDKETDMLNIDFFCQLMMMTTWMHCITLVHY